MRRRIGDLLAACVALVVSGGWYLLLVELWPASARPYIGGSQHDSIVELALGYNGLGRLTGDEPGGLGNLNFDVGWGRLFGSGMGLDIAWLLPAAVICLAAGFVITRRAPRTDPTRAALILWGGWLAVTAVVFSFANGILHPTTPSRSRRDRRVDWHRGNAVWRNRSDIRAATALSARSSSLRSSRRCCCPATASGCHGCGRRSPSGEWEPPCCCWSPAVARPVPRSVAALAVAACLAAPAVYSVATAATAHSGAIPSVGPARQGFGGFTGPGGLLDSPSQGPRCRRRCRPMPTISPGSRPPSGRTTRPVTNWPAARR